jgi:hypothetical protein
MANHPNILSAPVWGFHQLLILLFLNFLLLFDDFLFFVLCLIFFSTLVAHHIILSWLFHLTGGTGLLPFDFIEPITNMRMLWFKVDNMVKGSASVVKLPLHQACIPEHKGIVRGVLIGLFLRRNA